MDKESRRVRISPDSEFAAVIKEAAVNGSGVEVHTGEETYQVEVKPIATEKKARALPQLARVMAGSLAEVDIPEWGSSELAERWVDELRKVDTFPLEPPSRAPER